MARKYRLTDCEMYDTTRDTGAVSLKENLQLSEDAEWRKLMTEGRKDDSGKLRWDLVPASFEEVVYVYTAGAQKYADRNWENGLKWGRVFGAMMRHAWAWWWSKLLGKGPRHEKNMHHLGSVAWCALALMEYERTHPELDDRPGGNNESA